LYTLIKIIDTPLPGFKDKKGTEQNNMIDAYTVILFIIADTQLLGSILINSN